MKHHKVWYKMGCHSQEFQLAAMNTIAVESVRSKMNRDLLPVKDSFVYIADFPTALKYAGAIEESMKIIAVDTEHYNFSQSALPTAKFPYPVTRYNVCGPFVALLQISGTKETYVFDILAMGDFPNSLKQVLEGSGTTKLVFDYHAEACALNNTFGVRLQHVLDLQRLSDKLTGGSLIRGVRLSCVPLTVSLRNTISMFFDQDMDKSYQRFNWKKADIPFDALRYAVEDARVLVRLMQFIATACSLVWANRRLCDEMVEDVARKLLQDHGCKIPPNIKWAMLPKARIATSRVYRVFRLRHTCIYE